MTSRREMEERPGDCKEIRDREFCPHCGAGIGQHRRDGEGTCEKCDPPDENGNTKGFQGV